jgi:hypothetical protein
MQTAMTAAERQKVLDQLTTSEARLIQLTKKLTPTQWNFREAPERWSIAENIEHVILFENFIKGAITRVMQQPPEPGKKSKTSEKESLVLGLANARHIKFATREVNTPTGKWPAAQLIPELKNTRAETQQFITELPSGLREHFFTHIAFGDLDCYQWLLMLGQHASRHAKQIEQIKTHQSYPTA